MILIGSLLTWLDMVYGPKSKTDHPVKCGIPIYMWHQTFLIAIGVGACFRPLSLCIRTGSKFTRGHLGFIKLLVVDGFLV